MTEQLQQARRHDPYPWTWEIPLAVVMTVLAVLILGAQLGRSLANLLAGAGWTWPPASELVTSLPGIITGDATAGLTSGPSGKGSAPRLSLAAPDVADAITVWIAVGLSEVLLLAALLMLGVAVLRRWGPGRMRGVATPAEAERLLGRRRLRSNLRLIRPDLQPVTDSGLLRRQRWRDQNERTFGRLTGGTNARTADDSVSSFSSSGHRPGHTPATRSFR